jgi:hypothetical protein
VCGSIGVLAVGGMVWPGGCCGEEIRLVEASYRWLLVARECGCSESEASVVAASRVCAAKKV